MAGAFFFVNWCIASAGRFAETIFTDQVYYGAICENHKYNISHRMVTTTQAHAFSIQSSISKIVGVAAVT